MTTTKTTTTRTTMMVVTVMITTVVVVTMTTCWSLGWHPNAKTSARRLAESLVVIYIYVFAAAPRQQSVQPIGLSRKTKRLDS